MNNIFLSYAYPHEHLSRNNIFFLFPLRFEAFRYRDGPILFVITLELGLYPNIQVNICCERFVRQWSPITKRKGNEKKKKDSFRDREGRKEKNAQQININTARDVVNGSELWDQRWCEMRIQYPYWWGGGRKKYMRSDIETPDSLWASTLGRMVWIFLFSVRSTFYQNLCVCVCVNDEMIMVLCEYDMLEFGYR